MRERRGDGGNVRSRLEHMLEVVEDEEPGLWRMTAARERTEIRSVVGNAERASDRRQDKRRDRDRVERNENNAVREGARDGLREVEGEPRFADPAGTGDGDNLPAIGLL
jgi:hypothetical protein